MVRIGFSTTNQWISRLIRWVTDAEVSHVFLIYNDNKLDQDMVLDVAFSGYRVLPLDLFARHNTIVHVVEPAVDLTPGMRVVARWLGRPYDWRAFVAFSRWFRSLRNNPTENPKAIICTEVVVHALRLSGYPGSVELDPKGTTPQALLDFLRREE
jgi:hypothetical protein